MNVVHARLVCGCCGTPTPAMQASVAECPRPYLELEENPL